MAGAAKAGQPPRLARSEERAPRGLGRAGKVIFSRQHAQLERTQSALTHAEDSALRLDMPQCIDEDEAALRKHRLSFSPAAAVWSSVWTRIVT